jgi:septum formation topological specificity factor MinE
LSKLAEVLLKKQKNNFSNNTLTIYLAYEIERDILDRNRNQIKEMIANKYSVDSENIKIEYAFSENSEISRLDIPTIRKLESEKPPW